MSFYRGYFVPGGVDPWGLDYCSLNILIYFGSWCVDEDFYHQVMGGAQDDLVRTVDTGRDRLDDLSTVDPTGLSGTLNDGLGTYIEDGDWGCLLYTSPSPRDS